MLKRLQNGILITIECWRARLVNFTLTKQKRPPKLAGVVPLYGQSAYIFSNSSRTKSANSFT